MNVGRNKYQGMKAITCQEVRQFVICKTGIELLHHKTLISAPTLTNILNFKTPITFLSYRFLPMPNDG